MLTLVIRYSVYCVSSIYLPLKLFQSGFSPVYVASLKGYVDVVDLLVKAGANIHIATFEVLVHLPSLRMCSENYGTWLCVCPYICLSVCQATRSLMKDIIIIQC